MTNYSSILKQNKDRVIDAMLVITVLYLKNAREPDLRNPRLGCQGNLGSFFCMIDEKPTDSI